MNDEQQLNIRRSFYYPRESIAMNDEQKVVLTHIDIPIMVMAEMIFKFIIACFLGTLPFTIIYAVIMFLQFIFW